MGKVSKLFKSLSVRAGLGAVAATAIAPAMAADIDFSTMTAAVSAVAVIAAIVGMGVVKIGPGFAKWAIGKVSSFFG
jgi:hypothetical protein